MTITRESRSERFRPLNDKELLGLLQSGDLIDLAKEVAAEEAAAARRRSRKACDRGEYGQRGCVGQRR